MPAPKGRYPPARSNPVPKHTEPLRIGRLLDALARVGEESCS
jgi:hypothetical protein